MELDQVLESLSPLGRYQVRQTALFVVGYLSATYSLYIVVFTGQAVTGVCAPAPNDSSLDDTGGLGDALLSNASRMVYDTCAIRIVTNTSDNDSSHSSMPCLYGMQYDKPRDFSLKSEFDLVCERSHLVSVSQMLLMLGQTLGSAIFTSLSDRYGRKRIQIITHALLVAGNLALGFAANYVMYAVLKVLVGMVQQGVVLISVTANMESYPRRHRVTMAALWPSIWWSLSGASLTAWALALRGQSWRTMQLATSAVGLVILLPQILFQRETMRWLLANGRVAEVRKQLRAAARTNGSDLQTVMASFRRVLANAPHVGSKSKAVNGSPDVAADNIDDARLTTGAATQASSNAAEVPFDVTKDDVTKDDVTKDDVTKDDVTKDDVTKDDVIKDDVTTPAVQASVDDDALVTERLSFLDLIRHPRLRTNVLCLSCSWFVNSLTFFGLILMSGSLTDNIYLSFFLNIIVEIPAGIANWAGMDKLGRRRTLLLFHAIAGCSLLVNGAVIALTDLPYVALAASLAGKFAISASFYCVFAFTPEIFPTNIRNLAVGTGSVAARIGGMCSPFMSDLAVKVAWGPGAVCGVCNLMLLPFLLRVPDSRGRELPQTLSDLESWWGAPKQDTSNTARKDAQSWLELRSNVKVAENVV